MASAGLEVKFFEAVVFPGLLGVKTNKNRFHLPEQIERYVDEFVHDDSPFEMYLPVIQPEHFLARIEQLANLLLLVKKLDCERAIMCFRVSSKNIFRQFQPLFVDLLCFARTCLILSLHSCCTCVQENYLHQIDVMASAPDVVTQ